MKIHIDQEVCIGDGSCEEVCPEVFVIKDDGLAYVIQEEPPESLRYKVVEALEGCPVEAIVLDED